MDDDLPFIVEYAKSGRAACKKCKGNVGKDSLRMGIMIQSPRFDGKIPLWHHMRCFFEKKTKLQNVSEIANFANLRWEDQEKIKQKMDGTASKSSSKTNAETNSDYSVDYAKSNRSICRGCGEKIQKGVIRISKLDDEPQNQRYGPAPLWHHVDCFVTKRNEFGFTESADTIPGFSCISEEDRASLLTKIASQGEKRKAEEMASPPAKPRKFRKEEKVLKEQSTLIFDMRDKLKANLSKKEMTEILEFNNQHVSTGESRLLDHLADCLVFGALKQCPDCKSHSPRFLNNTYICGGHLTEWTRCQYQTKYPERTEFLIPESFKKEYSFLESYKTVVRERQFAVEIQPDLSKKSLPLEDFKIMLFGKSEFPENVLEKKIKELGATVVKKLNKSVNLCISTPKELESNKSKSMLKIKESNIHVVSYDFLDVVRQGSPVAHSIKQTLICSWGDDPILKFGIKKEDKDKSKVTKEDTKSRFKSKSGPQTMKVTVHGSAAVDPESGLDHSHHVYQHKGEVFNVVLASVDTSKGKNSYYKLQLLEHNKSKKYSVFRAWGRVGTTIGAHKVENFDSLSTAKESYEFLYTEKTLNKWSQHKNFVKRPGGMYPLDIDYGQDEKFHQQLKPGDNSKLVKQVQELICLIFDIEAMKKALVEFEIDLEKMPLGKLSKKQIEMAYKVLGEAQQILDTGCNNAKVTDVTNRFFTLIPHDFGMKKPPLLNNEELIKSKIEMLDSLMEIEIAYNLLKTEDGKTKDPVDEHYEKLKTDIDVLEKSSSEYQCIKKYLSNTHAATHNQYSLQLQQVFKINRHGEKERYQKFKDLHNKKLLWHGSRLTNFVGILSQGLRIAPPEAPATGYMFGKGVYFADMVSKSANYCFTNKNNSTGILLLCEVALGDMYERVNAEYVTKLPDKKHSTFGMGQTVPNPSEKTVIDGVEVPYGKPSLRNDVTASSLLYNEYIVYDVNQINIKYLLKVDFKWKW